MTNPFDPGYYGEDELRSFGFLEVGSRVQVARNCTILGLNRISIGSDVRIDGYSTIVAGEDGIRIGSNVHIGGSAFLAGGEGIELEDFSGLSQGVRIYTRTDDYSGRTLTNPTVPDRFKRITRGKVRLGRHAIIGSGTVILPGVEVGEGASVGALSLVTKSLPGWGVYFGSPARHLKSRARNLLELEAQYRESVP